MIPNHGCYRNTCHRNSIVKELDQPSGLEPESQASDACALSCWTMAGWGTRRESNPDLTVRTGAPCALDHAHILGREAILEIARCPVSQTGDLPLGPLPP